MDGTDKNVSALVDLAEEARAAEASPDIVLALFLEAGVVSR